MEKIKEELKKEAWEEYQKKIAPAWEEYEKKIKEVEK